MSTGDLFVRYPNEGTVQMIVIGADTHKQSHTVGAVDAATRRVLAENSSTISILSNDLMTLA